MNQGFAGAHEEPEPSSDSLKKGDATMKFMMTVKHKEGLGVPPKKVMDAVGTSWVKKR
jgi:hypothetical protein